VTRSQFRSSQTSVRACDPVWALSHGDGPSTHPSWVPGYQPRLCARAREMKRLAFGTGRRARELRFDVDGEGRDHPVLRHRGGDLWGRRGRHRLTLGIRVRFRAEEGLDRTRDRGLDECGDERGGVRPRDAGGRERESPILTDLPGGPALRPNRRLRHLGHDRVRPARRLARHRNLTPTPRSAGTPRRAGSRTARRGASRALAANVVLRLARGARRFRQGRAARRRLRILVIQRRRSFPQLRRWVPMSSWSADAGDWRRT
jgi:hypothetical protein